MAQLCPAGQSRVSLHPMWQVPMVHTSGELQSLLSRHFSPTSSFFEPHPARSSKARQEGPTIRNARFGILSSMNQDWFLLSGHGQGSGPLEV
jgi:hypothetical protein